MMIETVKESDTRPTSITGEQTYQFHLAFNLDDKDKTSKGWFLLAQGDLSLPSREWTRNVNYYLCPSDPVPGKGVRPVPQNPHPQPGETLTIAVHDRSDTKAESVDLYIIFSSAMDADASVPQPSSPFIDGGLPKCLLISGTPRPLSQGDVQKPYHERGYYRAEDGATYYFCLGPINRVKSAGKEHCTHHYEFSLAAIVHRDGKDYQFAYDPEMEVDM